MKRAFDTVYRSRFFGTRSQSIAKTQSGAGAGVAEPRSENFVVDWLK